MIWVRGSCCRFGFYFVATAVLGGWNVLRDPQYALFIGGIAAVFGLFHAIGEIVGDENVDSAAGPSQPVSPGRRRRRTGAADLAEARQTACDGADVDPSVARLSLRVSVGCGC